MFVWLEKCGFKLSNNYFSQILIVLTVTKEIFLLINCQMNDADPWLIIHMKFFLLKFSVMGNCVATETEINKWALLKALYS